MRRSPISLAASSVVALSIAAAPVFAQEATDDADAAPANAGQTEVTAVPTEDDEEPVEQVPDPEKAAEADTYIAEMKSVLKTVLGFLEEARAERDVVKLNCVNEKLTAVKGLLRISESSDLTLREALARRDSAAASHEFEKIAIAARKVEQLRAESEGCVGELAVYSGDTSVEVVISDSAEPPPDPAAGQPPIEVVVRPPAISPSTD